MIIGIMVKKFLVIGHWSIGNSNSSIVNSCFLKVIG